MTILGYAFTALWVWYVAGVLFLTLWFWGMDYEGRSFRENTLWAIAWPMWVPFWFCVVAAFLVFFFWLD